MHTPPPSTSCTNDPQRALTDVHAEFQITRYVPMIKAIARPYLNHLPPSLELNDLISVGMCGLWEARTRFDTSKGVSFEAFATIRIRGAILDEIRRMSWVSRGTLQHIELVNKTEGKLVQRHGQPPTAQQVASYLGTTTPWIDAIKQHSQKITFQRLSYPDGSSDEEVPLLTSSDQTPLDTYEKKEQVQITQEALNTLPSLQAHVLSQYYFAETPMKTIGENCGLTESRISQIHSQALKQLRIHHWTSPLRTAWSNIA